MWTGLLPGSEQPSTAGLAASLLGLVLTPDLLGCGFPTSQPSIYSNSCPQPQPPGTNFSMQRNQRSLSLKRAILGDMVTAWPTTMALRSSSTCAEDRISATQITSYPERDEIILGEQLPHYSEFWGLRSYCDDPKSRQFLRTDSVLGSSISFNPHTCPASHLGLDFSFFVT